MCFGLRRKTKKCELNIDTINPVKISLAWLNINKGKAEIRSWFLVLGSSAFIKNKEKP